MAMKGQGPEHSSARLERFLQLCADDNMQVVNCTTPANYFHALRRQMQRNFRKPLVVMTPKSLLRHKRAVSKLSEFGPGSSFHRVLWDDAQSSPGSTLTLVPDEQIKRVILCSGKVYYDLFEEREKRRENRIQILRLEQIYPFPGLALTDELTRFPERRDRLVPGRAEEPGRLDVRRAQYRELHGAAGPQGIAALRRPQGGRVAGRGPGERASGRTPGVPERRADAVGRGLRGQSMSIEIKVPTLGESVTEATIARWLKNEGDAVKRDEPLVELETDKVKVEVPSPAAGVLEHIEVKAGGTVNVGAVLGAVKEGAAASSADSKPAAKARSETRGRNPRKRQPAAPAAAVPPPPPSVRRIAEENNLDVSAGRRHRASAAR